MEREDNFRLKRFKELKIKKQSKDFADKEGPKKDDKENITITPIEVKLDDKKQEKEINEKEKKQEKVEEKVEEKVKEKVKEKVEEKIKEKVEEKVKEKVKEKIEEKVEERMTEPNINLNYTPEKDKDKLKNQGEYKTNNDQDKVGNAPYFDEPWNNEIETNLCKCSPLFMSIQEVCQAEMPDQILNLETDKVQDTTLHKEKEVKISKYLSPCNSEVLMNWLKKTLEEIASECLCGLNRDQKDKEDIAICSQNIRKYSTEFSKLSVHDSTFSVNSKVEDKLGSYESKYKEIIKVSRLQNEDGTVRQKRKIVTVRTDKRNPMKTKPVSQNNTNNDQNSVCRCSDSSSESGESTEQYNTWERAKGTDQNDNDKEPDIFYRPTDTRSEPVCTKCTWDKPKMRTCISAENTKNTNNMSTITCYYPSDRKVFITINDEGREVIDNTKELRLPLVSAINVNFCDIPKNVMLDLRDCPGSCNETNEQSKDMMDEDLSKISEPKRSVSTCMCDQENDDLATAEKSCQSSNNVCVEIEAFFENTSTGMAKTAYIFNKVVVNSSKRSDDRENTTLQLHDFSYIFSKVKKVRHDPLDKKIEESQRAVNTDIFFKECSTRTTTFPYIFSSYQRSEVDNMVKRACFDIPEFPYIFSKTITKTPCICNTKSVEIDALFNNACKRSYSCTYIFNHLKNIKINAMIKNSCMNKVDFPYIFSTVKTEIEDEPSKDATLRTAEIKKMFKNIRKPVTEFTYILNHVNTVKIADMFKEACKQHEDFPYVFSNATNKPNNRHTLQKNNEKLLESCKQSCVFPYIFSSSRNDNATYIPCKRIKENQNDYSYMFSKTPETVSRNGTEFKNMYKQACVLEDKLTAVINNILLTKTTRNFQQESLTRLKVISDLFKESVRSMNSGKHKFKYVYKNEVSNDVDEKTSTDLVYMYTMCDASTSTDDVNCGTNKTQVTAIFKQTCRYRSEHNYFPNEVECRKTDIVQRASESTLHDVQNICKDYNYIFNKINKIDIKTPNNAELCNSKCGTSDATKTMNMEEKSSEILSVVDINTMFKDSCGRKNEFTYVLNKPTNKRSCELARRTTDLRLQQMSEFENYDKNDQRNFNTTNVKVCESNEFMKTPNLIKLDDIFKDSYQQKNSFTYVLNKPIEDKVSCELVCRTSDLRSHEIEKLSTKSKNSTCGYETCIVCNPDRCLNPNYVKIYNMVRKACKQKNEFTYVLTKYGNKPVQLARRTSHLLLHEISKITELNSKTAAGTILNIERSKTDFTCLLRKALESIEIIKSNSEKYRNVTSLCDTTIYEYDSGYVYHFNKANQEKKSDLSVRVQKSQEIDKIIRDSCILSSNPKYDYIFQKVPKPCTCTCNRENRKGLARPCSLSYTNIVCEKIKSCNIETQSTCSFVDKRKHRFIIQIPNGKENSGTLGIEVMWKSSGVADKNTTPKSIQLARSKRSIPRICSGASENTINNKKSWCRSTSNKSNRVRSESNDVSLIRRMIDSVKNVYVPFLKPSVSKVKKEVSQPKADNVNSLKSNSTTSTYSWKSSVMKTCQADIECVEKNISYSGFSYGSSLDFVSYKSEGVGSEFDSAVGNDVEGSTVCKSMKCAAEKLLTFDFEINSGSSLNVKDSVTSSKTGHCIRFDTDISDNCLRCGRIKLKPKTVCSKCNAQNPQIYRLSKSPKPSCASRQNNNMLNFSCSCIAVSVPKNANEPDYWYNLNKRKKVVINSKECLPASEQNVSNKSKQSIRKCRSYDDNDCCSSKNSSFF